MKETLSQIEETMANVYVQLMNVSINEKLEEITRLHSIPKIKGDITTGKIKWRGLKKVCQRIGNDEYIWIEQRGVMIGDKIKIEAIIGNWKIEMT